MKQEKSCGAVIYHQEGGRFTFLVLKHRAGHWAFTKGHQEEGENDEETALREIAEETGLRVNLDSQFCKHNRYQPAKDVEKDVFYFLARAEGMDVACQQEEIRDFAWLDFSSARERLTFENDRTILDAAYAYLAREG